MNAVVKAVLRVCLLLVLAPGASSLWGADEPPNVLLIIADDLNGYGFFDGYPGTLTPALDALKASSVVFEHAYAAAPLGEASRAAFFSGIYPHRSGAYRNGADSWGEAFSVFESMPERFHRDGYTTFGAGRVPEIDNPQAWDQVVFSGGYEPFPGQGDLLAGGGDRSWGVKPWFGPDSDFPDTVNADALIEFLQHGGEKPFFAVYGLWRPHPPFTAPRRFFDRYAPDTLEPPPGYREGDVYDIPDGARRLLTARGSRWLRSGKFHPDKWRRVLHGYLAATSFADWNIGRVLAALDETPHAANTIVVFWSDNGLHLGEKNHFGKATPWEPALRTPAAIRLPGNVNNGRVVQQPVSAVDFYPTLADYCGLGPANPLRDGLSLRPLLERPDTRWRRPAISTFGVDRFSANDGRYRYIRYADGGQELYDLRSDPHEFINLAEKPDSRYIIGKFRQWIPQRYAPDLGGRDG